MINVQPTVFIGLGEVGLRTISYLKKRIYEVHGPLESVMMLAITVSAEPGQETDRAPLPYELLPTEHLQMTLAELGDGRNNDYLYQKFAWLPQGALDGGYDHGESPALARLSFLQTVAATNTIGFLRENLLHINLSPSRDSMEQKGLRVDKDAAVYIIAALDDPVGSGLFLDIPYLIRDLIHKTGLGRAANTGVFFLPDAGTMDVARGAIVYGALKELDYHMSGGHFSQQYDTLTRVDSSQPPHNRPPFEHGCFLLDTVNERQYALGSRDQASAMLGEWLYQSSLTRCKPSIDGFMSQQRAQMVEDRLATYGSLGLSGYILPIDDFVDWCARKLGGELLKEYVLNAVPQREVAPVANDFLTAQSLYPDSFKQNVLKLQTLESMATRNLAILETSPISELQKRATNELSRTRSSTFAKDIEEQIAVSTAAHRDKMVRELKQSEQALLRGPKPNSLSMAMSFFDRIKNEAEAFRSNLQQELTAQESKIANLSNVVNRRASLLFQSMSTLPQSPVDYLLIIWGAIVAFLLPVFFIGRLVYNALIPINAAVGWVVLLLLVVLSVGSVVYVAWHMRNEVDRARDQFVVSLRAYLAAQVDYLGTQRTLEFMPELSKAVSERFSVLQELFGQLSVIRTAFVQASASTEDLTGAVDFPLQRSLLNDEFIDEQYQETIGDLETQFKGLVRQVNKPADWIGQPTEQLQAQFLAFGRTVFEPLRRFTINNLLELAPDEIVRQNRIQRSAEELLNKSAPMWNYVEAKVGQDLAGAGTLHTYGLLAMDDPAESQLDDQFQKQSSDLKTAATHDPYRMQVIKMRQGLPLFGLRAFDGFRQYYGEALQQTNRPLHISDAYLRVTDPQPYPRGTLLLAPVDTLFAVGRVAELITRSEAGLYWLALAEDEQVELASHADRAVAVLGLQPEFAAALSARVNEWVEQTGKEEAIESLQEAAKDDELSAWEKKAIRSFTQQLLS